MAQPRPVVVLAGPTHADGRAQLEREVDVILCEEETEEAFLAVASGAHGILFRTKPRASDSLMAACPNLKVIGRHGVGLDTPWTFPRPPGAGSPWCTPRAPTRKRSRSTR